MGMDGWTRRRDLEGGKQVCIWLEEEGSRELYVEDQRYKGEPHAVWLYDDATDEWTDLGTFDEVEAAVDRAMEWATAEADDD
ncbi:hypothetical protein ACFQPA_04000 [Halomarina halobia]|uniref:Uncharacterized protein n=1 Tax=Halomarina halobia TaxID=3033386 RepID=A0ABD6A4P0_9EURY|nr:hypothetical protein [Halomarina sp. PSR21]